MTSPVYQKLASLMQARINCLQSGNMEWFNRHSYYAERICKESMPSGSGFDAGTKLDFEKSTPEKLVFTTSFHHMDENGGYCGWTDHSVIVTPSLQQSFKIRVTGKDRAFIKEYITDVFNVMLSQPCITKE